MNEQENKAKQLFKESASAKEAAKNAWKFSMDDSLSDREKPVSYTHLDVYKRQERKSVQAGLALKVVEFDHFEIRVVHDFPRSEEFQRGSGAEPVLDDIGSASGIGAGFRHIGQTDVVPLIYIHDRYGNILNSYRCCLFHCFHIIPLF